MPFENEFTWIVVAPGGVANLPLACEAARAGAWGFVDLEDVRDAEGLRQRLLRAEVGCRLPAGRQARRLAAGRSGSRSSPRVPPQLTRVILTRPDRSAARASRDGLRRCSGLGLEVLVEAVSVDEAARGGAGRRRRDRRQGERSRRPHRRRDLVPAACSACPGGWPTPFYAQGGVGLHTAAACQVAGASGAVLDWQLGLVEESRLPAPLRLLLSRLDGSETAPVGLRLGDAYRLYLGPRPGAADEAPGAGAAPGHLRPDGGGAHRAAGGG